MIGVIQKGIRARRRTVPVFRFVLAAAILLVAARSASALDPERSVSQALLRKWQIQQGLPAPTITVISQSSDKTLWLGTQAGLYQFDGVRFDSAPVIDGESLDAIWVNDLCEDRYGALWIATREHGLLTFHNGEVMRFDSPVPFPTQKVNCLLLDQQGDLWAGGDDGVVCHHDGTFVRYGQAEGLQVTNVRDMTLGPDGVIWIGGDGAGLSAFSAGKFVEQIALKGRSVNAILADRSGGLWVGTNRALLRQEPNREWSPVSFEGVSPGAFECLAQSREGAVWAGTRNGLFRLFESRIEAFQIRDGLSQSTVLTILEDHEGSLWVGTKNGLNQFVDRRTLPLTEAEGLPSNEAGPIVQDAAGRIWIGTHNGLARYNGRNCSRVANKTRNRLPSDAINSLAVASEEGLWIATGSGLCLWRDDQVVKTIAKSDGLPVNAISCVALDDAGLLWIGTSKGLFSFDGTSLTRFDEIPDPGNASVQSLTRSGNGLLAATSVGCYRISDGTADRLPGDPEWMQNIFSIECGPDGELWLAARGHGLMLIQNGKATPFTVADGLFDEEIVGIARHQGRDELWMGCSRGIFSVQREQLLSFAAGKQQELKCWSLSPTEALRTVECQRRAQPAVFRTSDDRIWFSTIHGVIVVDPERLDRGLPVPKVEVTRLMVNGRPMRTQGPITVTPGPLNLSVRYTANSYAAPTRTLFRYRLDGFDKQWIDAGTRREAFYTNLSPGTYAFQVSARNPGEEWTETQNPIQITLAAAFWQTPWFPLLAGVLSLGGVWLFLRLRVLRVRSRMDAILSERTRIARELHDTLIQGFSGVTMQMQAVSARIGESDLRSAVGEIIEDAGACLREARQSVAGLRNSVGTSMGLSKAIEQTARQLTETRDVRLQLELPASAPSLPVAVEFNLLRIAQEAITNAARHSHARTIDVALLQQPGRLALRVRDDGVGFTVHERERVPQHYGLIGMRERSRQISADLTIDSRPGAGTTILVDLPLSAVEPSRSEQLPPPPHTHQEIT